MSGRYRTVALQAVSVAILAAVVYLAFLRPSDPGELSKIDAPGTGEAPTVARPGPDKRDEVKKRGSADRGIADLSKTGKSQRRRDQNGSLGSSDTGVDAPAAGVDRPADDQYTDTVTRLLERARHPAPLSKIEP